MLNPEQKIGLAKRTHALCQECGITVKLRSGKWPPHRTSVGSVCRGDERFARAAPTSREAKMRGPLGGAFDNPRRALLGEGSWPHVREDWPKGKRQKLEALCLAAEKAWKKAEYYGKVLACRGTGTTGPYRDFRDYTGSDLDVLTEWFEEHRGFPATVATRTNPRRSAKAPQKWRREWKAIGR